MTRGQTNVKYQNKSVNVMANSKYERIKKNHMWSAFTFETRPFLLHISRWPSCSFISKENPLQIFHYCNRSVHATMNNDQNLYTALQISRGKQSPWGVLWQERVLELWGHIKHYSYRHVLSICDKKSIGLVSVETSQEPQKLFDCRYKSYDVGWVAQSV